MSQGQFVTTKCEDILDMTLIYPIKIQPETQVATIGGVMNTAPTGAINQMISAWIGKAELQPGFKPSMASFKWKTEPPTNYKGHGGRIPLLTKAIYDKAVAEGAEGVYLEKPIVITGVSIQEYR